MRTTGSILNHTSLDDMSERISVVYQVTQRNRRGDIIDTEEITRCMLWAKVLPISSRRTDDSREYINELSYRITIHHRTDIKPDDIILWKGKKLKQTIPPYDAESRKIYTVMTCEEMVKDGKS